MATRKRTLRDRIVESLKFWTVVAVLCVIVGVGAYHVGRNYVGEHLHEMEVTQRAPEILPQTSRPVTAGGDDERPPVEPVVVMQEREPTTREEWRVRRELQQPQDGAQLHAAEEVASEERPEEAEDAPEAESEPPVDAEEAPADGESFVVTAGAFADEQNAQRQASRLAERGYQPYITTVEKNGITYRRVNVGVFDERESAERVKNRLREQGFDAAVWTE